MSNPWGRDHGTEPAVDSPGQQADDAADDAPTQAAPVMPDEVGEPLVEEHPTEVMATGTTGPQSAQDDPSGERRYTAPSGMDSSATRFIERPADPATEVFAPPTQGFRPGKSNSPQMIPGRGDTPKIPRPRRSWGWVVALILVIAALAAVAILGTLLLTRHSDSKASQEDMVRSTIQNFDVAVPNGDLAALRTITCGSTRDSYVDYDDRAWADTHARVAAAKQYPVVASIDQVVVNGDHAEANVTTFMAYAPQIRSTRSFDLQFRDEQWKICQAPSA